jgi:hypothetical protein
MQTGRRQIDGSECAHGTVNCRGCIREANSRFLDFEPWVQISTRVRNLIKAVREHALANYNTGAWDIIVEAYSDSELAETVMKCRTAAGAVAKVAKIVEQYRELRAPHEAEIAAATEPEVAPIEQPEVEYDRFAAGQHPDGSMVYWYSNPESGESWAIRTYPGSAGRGSITVEQHGPDGDYVTVERYHPAWRGQLILADCDGAPF